VVADGVISVSAGSEGQGLEVLGQQNASATIQHGDYGWDGRIDSSDEHPQRGIDDLLRDAIHI
jgi:hypothetical protein